MSFSPFTWFSKNKSKLAVLQNTIDALESQIHLSSAFVKELEKGNLDATHAIDANQNGEASLATSLVSLRDQLKVYSLEEKQRNWVAQGLANFIDILRSKNTNNLSAITNDIIIGLVKYMEANQGALYIINDSNPNDIHLKMEACYAFERKKYLDSRFHLGEGMIGQAVLEKDTIYLTKIPNDYIRITSGLGDASPRELLIVPLKLDNLVYGVIELASFSHIPKYKIEFVERLAESIASTIGNVKINQHTQKLLEETQIQAEQMRSQEEEVRQNMEELTATQEEMARVLNDVREKEVYLNNLLNASGDAIMTVGLDFKIVMYNKYLEKTFAAQGINVAAGMSVFDLAKSGSNDADRQTYQRAFQGETIVVRKDYFGKHYEMTYQPLHNNEGVIKGALMTTREITKDIQLLNQMEAQKQYLNELINVPKDSILTIDKDLKILTYNKAVSDGFSAMGITSLEGFEILSVFPDEVERAKQKSYYERAFKGENFDVSFEFAMGESISYFNTNFAPLKNAEGEIIAVASFTKDITEITLARKEAERLLEESKQTMEEMRAQEEELRQNMEEVSATQEEMTRVLKDVSEKEQYLNELINVPQDSIFTLDTSYNIVSYNKSFAKALEAAGITQIKGFCLLNLFPDPKEKQKQIDIYQRAFNGENFEVIVDYDNGGDISYYSSNYAPLRNTEGEIFAVACFSKDITALMNNRK